MELFLKILYTVILGIIVGSYRSLMENDYHLDLPNVERGKNNKIKIYVGSLVTYTIFYAFWTATVIFGGPETLEMVSSFTTGLEIKK